VIAADSIQTLIDFQCQGVAEEIIKNQNASLAIDRVQFHLEEAISSGYVARVNKLCHILCTRLTEAQKARLVDRCLELGETIDALCALDSPGAPASESSRSKVFSALIMAGYAANEQEAQECLNEPKPG